MLMSFEERRTEKIEFSINEDGFTQGNDSNYYWDAPSIQDGMGFLPIINKKGKITVYTFPAPGQRQKRDDFGTFIWEKDAFGNDLQIPMMEPARAEACCVFCFKREMELDENANPRRDEKGRLVYKADSKWEPIMKVNPNTGKQEISVLFFYKGGPTRKILPVRVKRMIDPTDPSKTIDNPNEIVSNCQPVSAQGSFIDFINSRISFTQAIIDAAEECGLDITKETTEAEAMKASKLIRYEELAQLWTRNPHYFIDKTGSRCWRIPIGLYEFVQID